MKTGLVVLLLFALQAQAKVLVVVTETYPGLIHHGINLHEVASLIKAGFYQGKFPVEFATSAGDPITIAGTSLEPKNYPNPKVHSRETEVQMYQTALGRLSINKHGVSPAMLRYIDALEKKQEELQMPTAPLLSLRDLFFNDSLKDYTGLIVIGGPEAVDIYPSNIEVQATVNYFSEKKLPIALSGYGIAALTSPGPASSFAGLPVAATEPNRDSPKRLDRMLVRAGLRVISNVHSENVISVREGKLITAQDWKSFDKLLEVFIPQIPQTPAIEVQK